MSLSESGLLDVASSSKTNGQAPMGVANGNGDPAGVEANAAMTEGEKPEAHETDWSLEVVLVL